MEVNNANKITRPEHFDLLTDMPSVRIDIESGKTVEEIVAFWQQDSQAFKEKRKNYLIY